MQLPKEIQELRASVEELTKQYKEIKASPEHDQKITDVEDLIWRLTSYVHQRISNLEDSFYIYQWDHSKGHIPAVHSAGKMKDVLKTLGLDSDYEVYKPMVMAASEMYGFEKI